MSAERQQGFTLFEVLVVLAIIGLVTAVMAPALFRGLGATQARAAAYEIAAALRQARSEAVAENADVAVVFDLARHAYRWSGRGRGYCPRVCGWTSMTRKSSSSTPRPAASASSPTAVPPAGRVTVGDEAARYQVDVDWLTGRISAVEAQGRLERFGSGLMHNKRRHREEANADEAIQLLE